MRRSPTLIGAMSLLASPAFAADLATRSPVYPASGAAQPVPVFTWTGWYIGGNAGYGWGANTTPVISFTDPTGAIGFADYFDAGGNVFPNQKPQGFIGGGQIGYDWQVSNWVVGLTADFQGADIASSATNIFSVSESGFVDSAQSLSERLQFLGTVRARLGWPTNNWLFYGSGGFAYGTVKSTLNFDALVETGTPFFSVVGSHTETLVGWAAGGGINYALTRNWIVGVDYLHYDLGHTSVTGVPVPPGIILPGSLTASQTVSGDIVRGVLSYKF